MESWRRHRNYNRLRGMKVWRVGIIAVVVVILVTGTVWLLSGRGAGRPFDSAQGKLVTVAATIFPLADIIKNIGGERVGVVLLIPPGVSEHSAALSPQTLASLQNAQAVFTIGQGLEDALVERVVSAKKIPVITVERRIALREFGSGGVDPHYWLTVPNASRMAQTIAEELTILDPEGGPAYAGRLADYQSRLALLEEELQKQAAAAQQKRFMAAHEAWSYFAPHYGLELVAAYEPVEGQQPSVQDLARIRGLVQQYGITTFYAEPQKTNASETKFLEREFGLKILVLDPVGGFEKEDSYEALMRRNMEAIVAGL